MDCLCTTGTVSQRMAEGAMIVDGWYHNIIIISYHSVFWFCANCDCVLVLVLVLLYADADAAAGLGISTPSSISSLFGAALAGG